MITQKPGNYGDLRKFKVMVQSFPIEEAVISLRIFQDIFTPTWTAQITVEDTTNMIMRHPISPGDPVTIVLESYTGAADDNNLDGEKEFTFVVHRIGNRELSNQGHQSYILYCVTQTFITNMKHIVQRSMKGIATDIAKTIGQRYLGISIGGQPSTHQILAVMPGWSPLTAISWLTRHATERKAADYIFFQHDNNGFSLKPFERIFWSKGESSGITFDQKVSNKRENGDYSDNYSVAVIKYEIEHSVAASNMAAGMYGNRKHSYDLINKTFDQKDFKYGDDIPVDHSYRPWQFPAFDGPEANISFLPRHAGMNDDMPSYLDEQDEWEQSRRCAVQKMNQERVFIQVPGSVRTWQIIGKNCEFNMPSHEQELDMKLDYYRKGRYLIAAVSHVIDKNTYYCNIELIKKRLHNKLKPLGGRR